MEAAVGITEQATEDAARIVCAEHGIPRTDEHETWIEALAWEIGEGLDYASVMQAMMVAAIEADRAQRGIIAEVVEVLDDRGAHAAAQLVRDTDPDDDLWNNYIGPMIDSIEDDYTGMAKEINA